MNNDAVSDQILAAFVDDAAWQQMEGILLPLHYESVACICPTIESRTELRLLSENIHQFALTLVTPLSSEYNAEFGSLATDL
jgi:hypothetical protein